MRNLPNFIKERARELNKGIEDDDYFLDIFAGIVVVIFTITLIAYAITY